MIVDYDLYGGDVADRIVERGRARLQRRQDAQAREAGRAVEFKPTDRPIKPVGPTCPACGSGAFLTGNMAFCRSRACKWQGPSGFEPAHSLSGEVTAA